jgi:fumarylacetoacetate (FAA) hydrolase family protein
MKDLLVNRTLPVDGAKGTLVGRAWVPGSPAGPSVIAIRADGVWDISRVAPTMSDLLDAPDPVVLARSTANVTRLGGTAALLANSAEGSRDPKLPWLLAPCDLQAIKASGVTFVASLLERVIEEQARGDLSKAETIRAQIGQIVGGSLRDIKPGSERAMQLKAMLIERGAWSQYLEVGIGPDAEIFTKAQPMSAVGTGAEIGLHPQSTWNNPEPEIVLAVSSQGRTVGAALGNDVNLRDFEGRSALLLGKSKDNNASCAIGPFVRLFDSSFGIDDVRKAEVTLEVKGADGYTLRGKSSLAEISRDPLDLVAQTIGKTHQYPDGFVLFLGTMFAPIEDRDVKGQGFTHKPGDTVTIATPTLGSLINRVSTSDKVAPWTFGARALLRNLAARGLLRG